MSIIYAFETYKRSDQMNDLLVAVFKKYYAGMTQAKIAELSDIQ